MEKTILLLIFSLALTLRVIFLSPWLEDWDSVQFALALHNYSLVEHQPHPPGYPLYIVLGRILNLFWNNDTLSLTLLSAILGAASSIPLFLLLRRMVKEKIALLATIIYLVTPLHWSLSEVALTNIPGTSATILTAWLLYMGRESQKYLHIGSFFAGLILGVRFAEYSIVVALLGLVLIHKRSFSALLKSAALILFGVSIWLVPLVIHTGPDNFFNAYTIHASYIITHDSIVQYTSILDRLIQIWKLFQMGYTLFFLPVILLAILHMLKVLSRTFLPSQPPGLVRLTHLENWPTIFALAWLLSYFLPLVFIYNLEVPRHVLPLLPPIILLFALSLDRIKNEASASSRSGYLLPLLRRERNPSEAENGSHSSSDFCPWFSAKGDNLLATAICIILVTTLFKASFTQVTRFKTIIPPTIAPVLYVKENFKQEETTLITTFTYRQFQYYAPEFENYYGSENSPQEINTPVVLIDYTGTKDKIPTLSGYNIVRTQEFSGPEDLFPRLPKTNLYILKKN